MTHNTVNEISGYIIYYTHNIYIQESCGKRSDSQWAIVYIYINNLLEKVYHKWRPWWRHLRNHPLFSRDTVHDYIPCCQLLTSCLWDNNGKHNRSVLFSTIFLHKFIAHVLPSITSVTLCIINQNLFTSLLIMVIKRVLI